MYDHVTPYLKRINSFVTNCSLRGTLRDWTKNACKIFLFYVRMNFQLQTLIFPELLKNSSNDKSYEDVS